MLQQRARNRDRIRYFDTWCDPRNMAEDRYGTIRATDEYPPGGWAARLHVVEPDDEPGALVHVHEMPDRP